MNETISNILKRVGTTAYQPKQIKDDELDLIIRAGKAAPNAFNAQNWHFSVIQDREILKAIDRKTFQALDEIGDIDEDERDYRPLYDAPALIILSAAEESQFSKQDCSCANQNMAVAAKSLNIGSRYLDVPNMAFEGEQGKRLRQRCRIPDGYEVICSLSLGYPADQDEKPSPRRDDVVSYVR